MDLAKILLAINTGIVNTAQLKSRTTSDVEEFGGKLTGHSSIEMFKRQISMMREVAGELQLEIQQATISAHQSAKDDK